jgi:hypothetical protein
MRNQSFLRACLGITTMLTAGCRDLTSLQQSNPGALDVNSVFTPANAVLITNGAIGDFECAFSRYVVGSGLFVDELSTAIANTANFDYDRRTMPTNAGRRESGEAHRAGGSVCGLQPRAAR